MRIRASTILKACYDKDYERRLAYRLRRKGFPELNVLWDVPQTPTNFRLVDEYLLDNDPRFNPRLKFIREFLGLCEK